MLVGLLANRRNIDGVDRDTLRVKYMTTLLNVINVVPVMIPTISDIDTDKEVALNAIRTIVKRVDMILLTGDESNIQPNLYGSSHKIDNPDPYRDFVAINLVNICIETKKPLLGICRGIQEINIAFGGTLHPDLAANNLIHTENLTLHRDEQYRPTHYVNIQPDGLLSSWYCEPRMKVNSLHNQAVNKVGRNLKIEAISDDGLVESLSYRENGNLILGVQWHPEWHADNEGNSKKLLSNFIHYINSKNTNSEASLV